MNDAGMNTPRGGADLECLFSYTSLRESELRAAIDTILDRGFKIEQDGRIVLFRSSNDSLEFDHSANIDNLIKRVKSENASAIILRFTGQLADVTVTLALEYDFSSEVLKLSVPEDMIWAFSNDPQEAEINRLETFARLCRAVAEVRRPEYAVLGTESLHADEIAVQNAKLNDDIHPYDATVLSQDAVKELFQWYTSTYTDRWS